jgi:hypothetical protein
MTNSAKGCPQIPDLAIFASTHENSLKMSKAYQIWYGIGTNAQKGEQK